MPFVSRGTSRFRISLPTWGYLVIEDPITKIAKSKCTSRIEWVYCWQWTATKIVYSLQTSLKHFEGTLAYHPAHDWSWIIDYRFWCCFPSAHSTTRGGRWKSVFTGSTWRPHFGELVRWHRSTKSAKLEPGKKSVRDLCPLAVHIYSVLCILHLYAKCWGRDERVWCWPNALQPGSFTIRSWVRHRSHGFLAHIRNSSNWPKPALHGIIISLCVDGCSNCSDTVAFWFPCLAVPNRLLGIPVPCNRWRDSSRYVFTLETSLRLHSLGWGNFLRTCAGTCYLGLCRFSRRLVALAPVGDIMDGYLHVSCYVCCVPRDVCPNHFALSC